MEPCYERSSKKQQIRMRKYNYIRGLEKSLSAKNCYVQIIKKKHHLNELNESAIFIVKKMHKIKTKNSCYCYVITISIIFFYKIFFSA